MYWFLTRLVEPIPFCLAVFAAALLLAWRKHKEGRRLLALWFAFWILLYLSCSPIVAKFCTGFIESGLTSGLPVPTESQAIVVLGGSLRNSPGGEKELGADSLIRCMHTRSIYESHGLPVVVCGGDVEPYEPGPTLAAVMSEFLERVGVSGSDIVLEDTSTTTYENAREAAKLLNERDVTEIVLITHAGHMLRARLCFERLGIVVHAAPCTLAAVDPLTAHDLIPNPYAAAKIAGVVHETLGLVWYKLNGRI